MRKTKIVCTLGPASKNEATMEEMLKAGMNVARINFSHGSHAEHKETIATFRKVRDRLKMPAAVMLDTKGPEIRIGTFKEKSVILEAGQTFTLTAEDTDGDSTKVAVTYKKLAEQLECGNIVLLDDGRIKLTVTEISGQDVVCRVENVGEISDKKGVNIPNVHLDFPYLSPQDEKDLVFGIEQNVDFVAASFVRSKEDVITLRKFLDYYGGHSVKIIAKIENMEGVDNFDEILDNADGIMVARGDMGVEIEYERLPGLQKRFIRKCYRAGKIAIIATQMLESMIHSPTPTRAEITDIANAVFDGTSAIMLSGETAVGDHPAHVVRVMNKIATQAEKDAFDMDTFGDISYVNDVDDGTNAICDAACTMARDVNAKAIIAVTRSGYTAKRVSKFRPAQPIIATTPEEKTYHQLSMSWGVYPIKSLFQPDANVLFTHAVDCAKRYDYIKDNDRVVITAGTDDSTDVLKLQIVKPFK